MTYPDSPVIHPYSSLPKIISALSYGSLCVREPWPLHPGAHLRETVSRGDRGAMDPYRAVNRTSGTTFWHGGTPGLDVGDEILSRNHLYQLGAGNRSSPRGVDDDGSVVYITDSLAVARGYAALYATPGDVYEVRPQPASSLRIDDDLKVVSLTAARGRIVGVAEREVQVTYEQAVRPIAPHLTWEDDSPVYTSEGFVTPAPNWAHADPGQLAELGSWLPHVGIRYIERTRRCVIYWPVMATYVARFPELANRSPHMHRRA